MNALQAFLIDNDPNSTETFKLESARLKKFDFTVSAISPTQYQTYQRQSITGKGKNKDMNTAKFNMLILLNHCVEPNFRDADFIKALGVASPADAVNRSLRAGEVQQLSEKILEMSGFNLDGVEEDMEEVKNS